MDNNEKRLRTLKEVATILNISMTTAYRMVYSGYLRGIKVGRQWRFTQEEIDRLLTGAGQESTEGRK